MMSSAPPPEPADGDGDGDMETLPLAAASEYASVASTFDPLLSAASTFDPPLSPPTPAAFPLSPASSSSFVDPPSYADVAASSPRSVSPSASSRSARAAVSEYAHIAVSDPETEAEPAATSLVPGSAPTYVSYLVTSARRSDHRRHTVRRRFRDFVTLADRLSEAFRGHFVPPRPDKNTVESQVMQRDEFVAQRRAALERYLWRLAEHPAIGPSDELRVFLQAEGKMPLPNSTDVASRMLDGAARLPRQLLGEETVAAPQDVVQPAKGGRDLLRIFKELKQSVVTDWAGVKPLLVEEDKDFLEKKQKLQGQLEATATRHRSLPLPRRFNVGRNHRHLPPPPSKTPPATASATNLPPPPPLLTMHPSSSSHPPDQPNSKSPPPPAPAMGYPAPGGAAYFAAPPPANGNAGAVAAFGVAYPYPAPPPNHHPPPPPPPPPPPHHYHYHPYPPHHHHHPYPPPPPPPTCLRRLLALVVAAFLLLGAGTFIVWLLLRPRAPAFSLASLSLSRVAYSAANSSLSASFDASLLADNPNSKLSVSYFSALASVALAPSSPIAVASLPPFSQGPRNTTTLAFRLEVDGSYVGPDEAAPLKSGGAGTVEVQVRLVAVAVFDRGGWRTRRRVMRVMCDGVPVRFRGKNATEAAFDGPARRCDVVL